MGWKVVSGISLALLLTSMFAIASSSEPVEPDQKTWVVDNAQLEDFVVQEAKQPLSNSNDEWPMFHHDLNNTGYSTSTAPNTNNTAWEYVTGDDIHTSSPAVVDNKVYIASIDNKIYCLNAITGAHIWDYTTGGGIGSSPAVADGKVYIGSADTKVYCLSAITGAFIWSYTTGDAVWSHPAVADGKVYVGSDDNKIYCLNAITGAHIWDYTTGGDIWGSPAVADGKVYIGSWDNKIYCLNAITGAHIWNYTTVGNIEFSSPAVADGRVYVGSWGMKIYCLNASTGAHIWDYTTAGGVQSSPAVADGRVYVGSDGSPTVDDKVYCLNAITGAFIWSYTTYTGILSSPAVADGKVYVGSSGLYMDSYGHRIRCLNATTGAHIWSYRTGDAVWSSPAVAYGRVYVGSMDNKVYAFEPDLDGDGLLDHWETDGIDYNFDGTIDLVLLGADPEYKDLYLEIDYMGSSGTHDHNPDTNAVSDVIQAFRSAPVNNPNGTTGIALHIDVDESITHQNVINVWSDFDTIKSNRFGTATQRSDPNSVNILAAKKMAYRYCLFIHQYDRGSGTTTSSGIAELPGNDFIVSLGAFDNNRGTRDQQAGTLMHELGHTLNLRHGGGDNINGKPNYLSIMSYSFQFSGLVPSRPLDYSRTKCPSLNENSLNESRGIQGPAGYQTVYGLRDPNTGNSQVFSVDTNTAIDWNRDSDTADPSVARSVNYFSSYGDNNLNVLESYDDWANIQYNFRSTGEYSDGVHLNVADQCITWEILEMIRSIIVNPTPDVAVDSVIALPTSVTQGEIVTITVVVKNEGNFSQGFIVSSYYDNTAISSQTVTILAPGGLRILIFPWNTAGVTPGTYTIKAIASTVPGETDTDDNTKIDGTVTVNPDGGVGGIVVPVDKLGLLAPYIGLASTTIIAAVATAIYVKRVKHKKERQ